MTESETPLLDLQGLTKEFDHRGEQLTVLEDLDFRVYPGDRVVVMGPSGAGKSTLLQIMGTLDSPTKGKMLFDGEDIFQRSSKGLAKFRNDQIGFVFQFHHLLPEFTALENVMMPGIIGRMDRQRAEERAKSLLEDVGLGDRLHHQPGELSGGEQQRVAVARALFRKPRLLLADEPTGNLDPKTGAGIHAILRELNEKTGVTVIIVTHDPRLAQTLPIRVLVDEGRLIPQEPGDPRLEGRIPDELLDCEPREAGQQRLVEAMAREDAAAAGAGT